jgi:Tol biopolymer transport system component
MKSTASLLSIIALGLGFISCSGGGGGGGGSSTPAVAVSTTAANYGVVDNSYTSTLVATGGTPPFTWTDVDNTLPLGLVFDTATGIISGTPTATTAHAFTEIFLVTDSGGRTASGPVTLRIRPRTDRASVNSAGNSITGSSNTEPSISRTSGRFIAFSSTASLVTGVTGNQVYVHDRQTGQPSLVSQSSAGVPGTGGTSNAPSISADGRFIAFVSTANLTGAPGKQVYRHDRQNGQTILVSKDSNGAPSIGAENNSPSISADGRFIAYVSDAANLVPSVNGQQIYLHDTQTSVTFPNGQTTLVSKNGAGAPATAGSTNTSPSISGNGRFIVFASDATNLGTTGAQQVYLHDTQGGQTILISKNNDPTPAQGNGDSSAPSISSDGCFVAFTSASTNLDDPAANQIYVRGPLVDAGCVGPERTTLVSKNSSGVVGNGLLNSSPVISATGRFIAFVSNAANLVPGVSGQQIYCHDTQTSGAFPHGQNVVVSLNSAGLPGGSSTAPSMTDDGGFITFSSSAPLIFPAAASDVYVRAVLP